MECGSSEAPNSSLQQSLYRPMLQIDLAKSFTKNSSGFSIIHMESNKEWNTQAPDGDMGKLHPKITKIKVASNGRETKVLKNNKSILNKKEQSILLHLKKKLQKQRSAT